MSHFTSFCPTQACTIPVGGFCNMSAMRCWQKVEGIVNSLEEVSTLGHGGIVKLKVCTITHLFCEDIRGIAFLLMWLMVKLLAMFNVASTLHGWIVAPFYACVVVIIKWGGHIIVIDGITKGFKMKNHVLEVNCKMGAHVCSKDFGVTQTQWGTILAIPFQVMGPPERNMMTRLILQNLKRGTWILPSLIALPIWEPQQASLYVVRWWCWSVLGKCIHVSFSIGWMREGHIGMERGLLRRSKREAIVKCQVNIAEHVEGSV